MRQGNNLSKQGDPNAYLRKDPNTGKYRKALPSDLQSSITYVARIRKVERNAFGIVKSIKDWKYRDKRVFDKQGSYVKEADRTDEQVETLSTVEEDKALTLRKKFYESRGIAYVETTDGKLIPFDPTRDTAP